jgi:hypothetical protein
MNTRLIALAVAAPLLAPAPALAHHSGAMFEPQLQRELHGVIREFKWSNPHAWIEIDVPGENGEPVLWAVEMTAPNNLMRTGWTRRTLEAGDEVVLTIRPLRDGGLGGTFVRVMTNDGVELPVRPDGAPAPNVNLGGTSPEGPASDDSDDDAEE